MGDAKEEGGGEMSVSRWSTVAADGRDIGSGFTMALTIARASCRSII